VEPAWTDWRDADSRRCSVARTADVIGDGWTVLVLRDVFNGIRRFDELATHLGVARNVLTRRLAALVEAGVLIRQPYREPGARVRHEYRLTEAGRDLLPVILAMVAWGDRHRAGVEGPPVVVRHADCGAPVHVEIRCAEDHHLHPRADRLRAQPGPGAVGPG
jgi:DNA-binding HxlR family transcriptional regulator